MASKFNAMRFLNDPRPFLRKAKRGRSDKQTLSKIFMEPFSVIRRFEFTSDSAMTVKTIRAVLLNAALFISSKVASTFDTEHVL